MLDEDLKPAAGVPVERDPNPRGNLDGNTLTNENGEFVFQDMASGSYVVFAKPGTKFRMQDAVRLGTVPIYYPSATDPAEAVRIPVRTGQNVAGIEIRLRSVPVHRVTGVVLDDAGKPAAHATVKLMASPGTSRKVLVLGMIMPSAPAGAGRVPAGSFKPEVFTIVGPSPEPEMTRVETRDDGNSHVTAVIWEGRDVNGQVVELAPGAAPFQVILSSGFGKVHGTVEEGDGTTVFLVSRESGEILTYRQVECRAGGAFEFGSVPAGDYSAVAFDHAETNGLPAADLPAVIASMASTVHVEAGSAAQVDLSVNKWPW